MASDPVDYDLHGLVGLRIENGHPRDVTVVTRQLGPIRKPLDRPPDITIRFVERIGVSSTVRLIGVDDAAFTDDTFLILRGKQKARVRVLMPFDEIGGEHMTIVAEHGVPAIPHLLAIINLTASARGALPLHASAFHYRGVGALATGWAKGGKTETLLAFAARGAHYVGDEWVYITPADGLMYGVPEPIRLWKWQLDQMPQYRRAVAGSDRARLAVMRAATTGVDHLSEAPGLRRTAAGRLLRRVHPILARQLSVQVPPERLFRGAPPAAATRLQSVFFVGSHDAPDVVVERVDPQEVASRMLFSLAEERSDFWRCYLQFLFAFPERRNPFLTTIEDREVLLLASALAGTTTYSVKHPYPFTISTLFDALSPILERGPGYE
ncbi:MAG TPA: hypothetical protein VFT85_04390 [Acidimicrobiia bacterium]|nr:hypothetical protein [Acidimicrobiia bacterium]